MTKLDSIEFEENSILSRLRICIDTIREAIDTEIEDVASGIALLRFLRKETAEEINQLQHAALILAGARHLRDNHPDLENTKFFWHPHQTGSIDEPDLRIVRDAEILISAEATASENPDGAIDARMANTLRKLQVMPGKKFYFVRTASMRQRAQTKVEKASYEITAIQIPDQTIAARNN